MLLRLHFKRILSNRGVLKRYRHVWTADNIIRSPYPDIEIPNTTLVNYVWKNLDKWADKTAVVCGVTDRQYKYSEIFEQSQKLGSSLRKDFNMTDGTAVAVVMPNIPEYPTVIFGILAGGGVATTINPNYTGHEVQRQLELSEAKLVITTPEIVPTIAKAFEMMNKVLPIIVVGESSGAKASFYEIVQSREVDKNVLKEVNRSAEDLCYLPYSSGTTGLPKGVELINRNIVANCRQQCSELKQYSPTTDTHQDTVLAILPMFHSYGLTMLMTHKLSVGAKLVTLPSFQSKTFIETLKNHKINLLYAAPPLVLFMGSHPDLTEKHFENLRTILCGAAPLPNADIKKLFNKIGREVIFIQGYGLTETGPLATVTETTSKCYASGGVALPNCEMRIVDKDMNNLGPNEVGELLFKGPNVMKGYKNNPEANREVFVDGWLRTGDVCKVNEEGRLFVIDRLKELIKVKGFQVAPAELEAVIKEHPDVQDAAVIGVPDEKTGERPKAIVIRKDGRNTKVEEIIEFIDERVTEYKRIKDIDFVKEIPKNASGKILRRAIKEMYA